MNDEIKQQLIEAVKLELKIPYKFTSVQKSILIQVHQAYLDWDDSRLSADIELRPKLAEFVKASEAYLEATEKLPFPDLAQKARKEVKTAMDFAKCLFVDAEKEAEALQKEGFPTQWAKPRGRPISPRLHFYVSQMAGWYEEFFGDKPGYGTSSKFPKLIGACLAVVEDNPDKNPPYKIIRNTLQWLRKTRGKGPVASWD